MSSSTTNTIFWKGDSRPASINHVPGAMAYWFLAGSEEWKRVLRGSDELLELAKETIICFLRGKGINSRAQLGDKMWIELVIDPCMQNRYPWGLANHFEYGTKQDIEALAGSLSQSLPEEHQPKDEARHDETREFQRWISRLSLSFKPEDETLMRLELGGLFCVPGLKGEQVADTCWILFGDTDLANPKYEPLFDASEARTPSSGVAMDAYTNPSRLSGSYTPTFGFSGSLGDVIAPESKATASIFLKAYEN